MSNKKYWVIAKVACYPRCFDRSCQRCEFKKWRCNNLMKFAEFLDLQHPNWRFFNVFEYRKSGDGPRLDSFTRNRRPRTRHL